MENYFIVESLIPWSKLHLFLGIFLIVSLLVIVGIFMDMWDGVHTARKTEQRVHSHRLRDTIAKMGEYWRLLMMGFLIDCLGLFFTPYFMPFATVLFGLGLIVIEVKSMFEHAQRRKSHTMELPDILKQIVACAREKDAHKIVSIIKENEAQRNQAIESFVKITPLSNEDIAECQG